MNLINFHKYPKNKKYVQENLINYSGQGLYHSYWIMPIGNGHNKYTFQIEYNHHMYEILVEEKHILTWNIGNQFDEENPDAEPIDSIDFSALGRINGQYIRLRSNGCRDFVNLNGDLKIIDITIENDHQDVPFMEIKHENQHCDLIMCPRQKLIDEALAIKIDLGQKMKLSYQDLFDKKIWNQELYFIFDDYFTPKVIPFRISEAHRNDNSEDILNAIIVYEQVELHVLNILLFYAPELDDEYNIEIQMNFNYTILNDTRHEEIMDYCYVMSDKNCK